VSAASGTLQLEVPASERPRRAFSLAAPALAARQRQQIIDGRAVALCSHILTAEQRAERLEASGMATHVGIVSAIASINRRRHVLSIFGPIGATEKDDAVEVVRMTRANPACNLGKSV
jgi:hypothetical protein